MSYRHVHDIAHQHTKLRNKIIIMHDNAQVHIISIHGTVQEVEGMIKVKYLQQHCPPCHAFS